MTFGDDSNPTPLGQEQRHRRDRPGLSRLAAADWLELTVGKMPMPLYVTPMIWDSDINPEGAAEKFKYSMGNVDLFATFGQFMYQDGNPDNSIPSSRYVHSGVADGRQCAAGEGCVV